MQDLKQERAELHWGALGKTWQDRSCWCFFLSGASWAWMSGSCSILNLNSSPAPSLTCPAVRCCGCTLLWGDSCALLGLGVSAGCWEVMGAECFSHSKELYGCIRHWLEKREEKMWQLQNHPAGHLLLCSSVFPGFASLSSLFSLSPYMSVQCQVQKVPDFASSSEMFP